MISSALSSPTQAPLYLSSIFCVFSDVFFSVSSITDVVNFAANFNFRSLLNDWRFFQYASNINWFCLTDTAAIFITFSKITLCKDTANRIQYKIKNDFFIFIVEMQPILSKDTANRIQYKIKNDFFIFIVDMQPILSKDTANRIQYKIKNDFLFLLL